MTEDKNGFTIIELLVAISALSLVLSIAMAFVSMARVKARDSKKIAESRQVKTALETFIIDKNSAPKNYYSSDGSYVANGTGNMIAYEDPLNPSSASNRAYEASMQELADNGYLSSIPRSLNSSRPYGYFNKDNGGIFISSLETRLIETTQQCGPYVIYTGPTGQYSIIDPNNPDPIYQTPENYYNYYCRRRPVPLTCGYFREICADPYSYCTCSM